MYKNMLMTVVALVSVGSLASAQEKRLFTPYGESVMVGAGATDFTDQATRNTTSAGGYWDVRASFGTRSYVGVEGAYLGAATPIHSLGMDSNALLARNGVEGNMRLNLPILIKSEFLIEPFVVGGVGWAHYSLTNTTTNTSSVQDNNDVLTLPIGTGIAFGYSGFLIDARFVFRAAYADTMLKTMAGDPAGLGNWQLGATAGYEF